MSAYMEAGGAGSDEDVANNSSYDPPSGNKGKAVAGTPNCQS